MKNKKSKVSPVWFAVIFAIAVIAMLVWTSLRAVRETPTRQVTKELPGQGWVTFNLTTNPYPPFAAEQISFVLTPMNRNNVALDFGQELLFSYGEKSSDTPIGDGLAIKAGSRYQARVQFPASGNYWLKYELGDGTLIEFQLFIQPSE